MILYTTCAIWNAKYTLVCHRDGTVTLKAPIQKWRGNECVLTHIKKHIKDLSLCLRIKNAFKNQTETLDGYNCATIYDAAMGYLD